MKYRYRVLCTLVLTVVLLAVATAAPAPVHRHNNSLVGTQYSKIVIHSKADLPQIDDVGGIIDNVRGDTAWVYIRPEAAATLAQRGFVVIWVSEPRPQHGTLDDYHNNDQIQAQFAAWQAAYPALFSYESIGTTLQGRSMWACRLATSASDSGRIQVKYIGAIHGDENVGTENCLRFAEELLTTYQTDSALGVLMNNYAIYMLPLMNPDGNALAQRGNANGVDMNRSFPDRIDDSVNTTAGRELEIAAVMNWTAAHNFIMSANFHGGTVVVNYPWDGSYSGASVDTPTAEDLWFEFVSRRYSIYNSPMWNSTEFTNGITNGCAWYNINGGMQDWNYVWMGCHEVTIELSYVKRPPVAQLEQFWQDNRLSMRNYLLEAQYGARGVVTDSVTGLPMRANISLNGSPYFTYSDSHWGGYYNLLRPGTYALTFSAPGYVSKTFTSVTVVGQTPTVLNVQLARAPSAQISVTPNPLNAVMDPCSQTDVPFTITNSGDVALTWSAVEAYTNFGGYGSSTGGGWRFVDSDHAGGPTYAWKDITSTGTAVTFSADDQTVGPYNIGFAVPFSFYGQSFTQYRICGNGWISFSSTSTEYANVYLPNGSAPVNLVAPWWDDLSPQRSGTIVRRWNNFDSLVVMFSNVQSYSGSGLYNFELILQSNGKITYQYASMGTNRLNSATIGLQNNNGTKGTTVVRDAAYIHNNMAISFCPSSLIALSPASGTVPANSFVTVNAHLNTCCVPNGVSAGTLTLTSNDPLIPTLNVAVNMNVTTLPPDAVDDLTVYAEGDGTRLTWSASANATGYRVWRMTSYAQNYTEGVELTTSPVPATTFADPTPGGLLGFYVVIAVR